jgi:hypothetical protein
MISGVARKRVAKQPPDVRRRSLAPFDLISSRSGTYSRIPTVLVAAAIAFNLFELRSESHFTPMLNDGAVHAQMVRAASAALRRGQDPLTAWYPYLGLGSPQFLHYQSLGAILTGAAGLLVGPNRAFAWSLYLLLSLWPASIYVAGRLFGLSRAEAGVASICASLLFSTRNSLGNGYEMDSYLWTGYGQWSQLCGMFVLPIAWGASWRFIQTGRFRLLAVTAGAATIASHYLTGYLVILTVPVWIAAASGDIVSRLRRGAIYLVGVLLCSAWVLYPVIQYGTWASQNEILRGTPVADSFGAKTILRWFFTGDLFDAGRLPVLTVLVISGLVTCLWTRRRFTHRRALIGAIVLSMLLFFGPPTLGPIADLVPGSHDLFFPRFLIGVQLAGIFCCGVGAIAVKDTVHRLLRRSAGALDKPSARRAAAAILGAGLLALLSPAWIGTARYDSANAAGIAMQDAADLAATTTITPVIAKLRSLGPGRVYAGSSTTSFGNYFTVGDVPVYVYLADFDFDVVGFTLRTASLMTDPEANFDENDVGDYQLFGIRYLLLPVGQKPVPPAAHVMTNGPYVLWELRGASNGYVQLVSTKGTIVENRTDIGANTRGYLRSSLPGRGIYETVAFSGSSAAPDTVESHEAVPRSVGSVVEEHDALDLGRVSATVDATTRAVVVLKASFDPGWTVSVDGRSTSAYMVAPALVAVTVARGRHEIVFQYRGFGGYPWLFGLAVIAIIGLVAMRRREARASLEENFLLKSS